MSGTIDCYPLQPTRAGTVLGRYTPCFGPSDLLTSGKDENVPQRPFCRSVTVLPWSVKDQGQGREIVAILHSLFGSVMYMPQDVWHDHSIPLTIDLF